MFVITADQKGSRHDVDRAGTAKDELDDAYAGRLALPVDRTAGDELQALVADAATALDMVLRLTRAGHWSVGLGVGEVRSPLPRATREATGPAFIAARDAVTAAKRSPTRFALAVDPSPGDPADDADRDTGTGTGTGTRAAGPDGPAPTGLPGVVEVEALITLLLLMRDRRTAEGWEIVDMMADGGTQRDAAAVLGITPQAVSTRLRTSGWRAERAAVPGLVALLTHLDRTASAGIRGTDDGSGAGPAGDDPAGADPADAVAKRGRRP